MVTGAVHGVQVSHALPAALTSRGPVMTRNPAQMQARSGAALIVLQAARPVPRRSHGTVIPKTFALEPAPTGAGLTAVLIPARSVLLRRLGTAMTSQPVRKQAATGASQSGKAVSAGALTMNARNSRNMLSVAMPCASQTLAKAS